MNEPRATIREIDGQLVLDDPDALAMIRAVAKHNCRNLHEANKDRIAHFAQRVVERGLLWSECVITVINVDDPNGSVLADLLMPGHDWQAYRDRDEIPIARGLATREGIEQALRVFDGDAAEKLHAVKGLCVVVVDQGVAEVYPASGAVIP